MKIINALSTLWMLLLVASCSMEDDALLNPYGNTMTGVPEVYASVEVSLHTDQDGVSTKGTSVKEGDPSAPTAEEGKLTDCYIAVFDAKGAFLGSNFYDTKDANGGLELTKRIIFRIPENKDARGDLRFVAVANVGTASSMVGLDYARLMESTFGVGPTSMPKVGETLIGKNVDGDYPAPGVGAYYVTISSNTADLDKATSPVVIKVKQRTAAIMLNSFNLLKKDGSTPYTDVKVTKIALLNTKMAGKVKGEVSSPVSASPLYGTEEITIGTTDLTTQRLRTYENTSVERETMISITYEYTNASGMQMSGTREYAIKSKISASDTPSNKVLSGYLYKLNVTILTDEPAKNPDQEIQWQVMDMKSIDIDVPNFD